MPKPKQNVMGKMYNENIQKKIIIYSVLIHKRKRKHEKSGVSTTPVVSLKVTRGLLWRVARYVITFRSEAMALPDWIITLVATSSFICFCLCLRYRRTGQVFWRKLFSKIMARTEKPLFRIAWVWRHFPWRQRFLSFPWRFSWRSLATSSHFYVL